jgi:cytochrome c5
MKLEIIPVVVAAVIAVGTVSVAHPANLQSQQKPAAAKQSVAKTTTGDDVFKANCSRCHMPPMSISPRTTGTIIMHMRTRARLSREDELKLLKFMAP